MNQKGQKGVEKHVTKPFSSSLSDAFLQIFVCRKCAFYFVSAK